MSIRPNTTCDIYRAGRTPPASPDVAGVPCCFISCFDLGRERGEKEAQQFRFTARMLVNPSVDVRDNFNAWTGNASNRDTVYLPDKNGIGYDVQFVERLQAGQPGDALCAYLDRLAVAWPYPKPTTLHLTHTADSLLKGLGLARTHTTDSLLKGFKLTRTHTTDSLIKKAGNLKTLTTDSLLKALGETRTHTTDSLLKALKTTRTHTTDSYLAFAITPYTIIQSTTNNLGSTTTSFTITWPGATTAGNLLVIVLGARFSTGGISIPGGWSGVTQAESGGELFLFYKPNAASQSSQTITIPSGTMTEIEYAAFELSPIATSNAFDVSSTNGGTSTSPSGGGTTTSQPELGIVAMYAPANFSAQTSGWVSEANVAGSTQTLQVYMKPITTNASNTCSATLSSSVLWVTIGAFFKHS